MPDPEQAGSDALQWLDSNMVESADAPDEAIDWIYMLEDKDWLLLEELWNQRPNAWRESCAYILGEGPVGPSQRLLRRGLQDPDNEVAMQAAISLCGQILEHPAEAHCDDAIAQRLMQLRQLNSGARLTKEIDEVLRRCGG